MPGLVADKTAFVTGAGSGIGRGTALVFAREGAKVAVADVNETLGRETVELIRASYVNGESMLVDGGTVAR